MSLLNIDLPFLISSNQTAYVEGRFISEGGRLFSDILQVTDFLNIRGLVVTVDIQKAFDSVNHLFLITALKNFGFGKEFIKWIQILLKNQESCIINGGTTTKYFKLQKGKRQGDPISAYLFILVLEIAFIFIKKKNIKGINIFDNIFLYSAYADDTTFFLSDEDSVIEVINAFHKFSLVSSLKPNEAKCEIAGIGVLKGVSLALCGMHCIDLTKKTIKVLGIHFSYNKKLDTEENFIRHVWKVQKSTKVMENAKSDSEGKITIFKTLAISKIIHLSLVTNVPTQIIKELNKIQKEFIWNGSNPKIKHSTLCNKYENGGLKNVDILSKVISLQCSWVKRLCDNSSHSWKIIPSHLINTYLGKSFKFHANLCMPANKIKRFPIDYTQIFKKWSENLSSSPSLPSAIASQIIWYNKCIKVDNKTLHNFKISRKDINYVGQLFKCDGKPKLWEELKNELNLQDQLQFAYSLICR